MTERTTLTTPSTSRYGRVPLWWVTRTAPCRTALAVAAVLAAHADAVTGQCYPSRKAIARAAGIADVCNVTRALRQLERLGIVRISEHRGKPSTYTVIWATPSNSDTPSDGDTPGASDTPPVATVTPTPSAGDTSPLALVTPKQTNNRSFNQREIAHARGNENQPDWVTSLRSAVAEMDVLEIPLCRLTGVEQRIALGRYLAWRLQPDLTENANITLGARFCEQLADMSVDERFGTFEVGAIVEAAKDMASAATEPVRSLWTLKAALLGRHATLRARRGA